VIQESDAASRSVTSDRVVRVVPRRDGEVDRVVEHGVLLEAPVGLGRDAVVDHEQREVAVPGQQQVDAASRFRAGATG